MIIAVYILAGLIGLCVGSFLNVVIYRVPEKMSIVKPASHCPKCGYVLRWYDNIPILSYLILGGKCRSCKQHISFRYTLVEVLNMLLWMVCVWRFWDWSTFGIIYACLTMAACSVTLCIAVIDFEHEIILDRFQIALFVIAVAAIFFDKQTVWWEKLIGMGVNGVLFLAVYYIGRLIHKRDVLGGGDVKFAATMGLLLGWKNLLLGMLVATITGSIVLLTIRVLKKQDREKEYPFAPFLVLGTLVGLLFGTPIVNAYIGWLTAL